MRSVPSDLTGAGDSALVVQQMLRTRIRSIQRGTITIGTGVTSATATITAVETANSRLRFLGWSDSGAAVSATEQNCYLELTNATTVTATHTLAGNTIVASFEVTEYWPGVVRSVERGTISITNGNATGTDTITAVDTAKTELDHLGFAFTNTGAQNTNTQTRITLTNATTVTATRVGTSDAITQSYQVIQWF